MNGRSRGCFGANWTATPTHDAQSGSIPTIWRFRTTVALFAIWPVQAVQLRDLNTQTGTMTGAGAIGTVFAQIVLALTTGAARVDTHAIVSVGSAFFSTVWVLLIAG